MTTVVDLHAANLKRKGYDNIEQYFKRNEENLFYISKKINIFYNDEQGIKSVYKLEESIFHNPFKSSDSTSISECLKKYKEYILRRMDPKEIKILLENKILACWCKEEKDSDKQCHGDILKEIVNEA